MVLSIAISLLLLTLQGPQPTPHIEGFGDWDIVLILDPATDRKSLALTSSGTIVRLSEKGRPQLITVKEHDCRSKSLLLSVDSGKPIVLGESGRRHIDRAMDQFLRGNEAVLAYYQDPCEDISYAKVKLQGFRETLEKARKLPNKELKVLEAQVLAIRQEEQRKEAEARLAANPSEGLLFAAREGEVVYATQALDAGADVNIRSENNGYTPLIWAASRGHIATARLLIEAGAALDIQANDGQTALMRTSDNGHLELVQLLLDAGADVNIETDRGITALLLAELKHHSEVAELLQKAGAQQ